MTPEAYFDSLSIIQKLSRSLGKVATGEVHLFAYLSCLVSLYRNRPASEWGYSFAGTKRGSPYSPEIEDALENLEASGFLIRQDDSFFVLSGKGAEELEFLKELSMNQERNPFLDGACASVLTLPIGLVREAISNTAEMRKAKNLHSTRPLFEDSTIEGLYEFFSSVSQKVGVSVENLMIPAVIWIKYISVIKNQA